ncbi:MAG: hypothetical protein NZL87_09935, partial [Thermomicrobium sp.]|nr:hypothetical protein [Thermomicrobium sp.]
MDIDGTLYAVTNETETGTSELITINTSNGEATELCTFSVTDVEGVTIANDGTMYISTGYSSNNPNRIYRVDNRNTCQVTLLSNISFGTHIDIEDIACPVYPTTVEMAEATATRYGDRVLLEWRTGYEVDTLGYWLYREENGMRQRLNESLITGSVLLAGSRVGLTAGRTYFWWDALPHRSGPPPRYWIEEIDLSGQRTLHGPLVPGVGTGPPRTISSTPLLSHIGRGRTIASVTRGSKSEGIRYPGQNVFLPYAARVAPVGPMAEDAAWATQRRVASGSAVKIEVDRPSWYRITQPELLAAGLDPRTDPRYLHLYVEGREVAMRIRGEEDGRLDPTDAIEFYGMG